MKSQQAAKATKKTYTLCLQVPPDLLRGLRAMAKYDGRERDEYITEILSGAVDAYRGDRRATRKAKAMGLTLREYEERTMPRPFIHPDIIDKLADGIADKLTKEEGAAA